jgi:hypothetical protein
MAILDKSKISAIIVPIVNTRFYPPQIIALSIHCKILRQKSIHTQQIGAALNAFPTKSGTPAMGKYSSPAPPMRLMRAAADGMRG